MNKNNGPVFTSEFALCGSIRQPQNVCLAAGQRASDYRTLKGARLKVV